MESAVVLIKEGDTRRCCIYEVWDHVCSGSGGSYGRVGIGGVGQRSVFCTNVLHCSADPRAHEGVSDRRSKQAPYVQERLPSQRKSIIVHMVRRGLYFVIELQWTDDLVQLARGIGYGPIIMIVMHF